MSKLLSSSAEKLIQQLKIGVLKPSHLLDILETHITAIDTSINALPKRLQFFKQARKDAQDLENRFEYFRCNPEEVPRSFLWGLPVVVKDLTEVKGALCTHGSPIEQFNVSAKDHEIVKQIRYNGGIPFAKSNVPEFGAGAQSFNSLFGVTGNPYDTTRTCGGSSGGGSAAALASGMSWLATGSDLGGSLRIPAAFCGVVGMRPSVGTLQEENKLKGTLLHNLNGAMGRNVLDMSILLDAMVNASPRSKQFQTYAREGLKFELPCQVGRLIFSSDIGRTCTEIVDPRISNKCLSAAKKLSEALSLPLDEEGMNMMFSEIDIEWLFESTRSADMWKKWFVSSNSSTRKFIKGLVDKGEMKPELAW
eukprot:CAMPEP_0184008646 /NCGR_PEP_ID=MMETSP0954-20121128/2099_1 /TAXON_ID=627963 /ORGANISM="Aplanochytrium sp, Strain PBS07" /LENGTH=363 /DNA_ID=CAMNT_0026287799 /DNA_START=66 /DNA_END=1154 /DNA_ORIENTATION=-